MTTTIPGLFLRGERIGFRPLELSDIDRCYAWINDPEVSQYIASMLPKTKEQERTWLEKDRGPNDFALALVTLENSQHIGCGGLHQVNWVDRHATMGLFIGDVPSQNKRYGREAEELLLDFAFRRLNLHRVEATVLASNPRSLHVAEVVGMQREGLSRSRVFRHGAYVDYHHVGILESEWFQLHPEPVLR